MIEPAIGSRGISLRPSPDWSSGCNPVISCASVLASNSTSSELEQDIPKLAVSGTGLTCAPWRSNSGENRKTRTPESSKTRSYCCCSVPRNTWASTVCQKKGTSDMLMAKENGAQNPTLTPWYSTLLPGEQEEDSKARLRQATLQRPCARY